jgi:hypothetical protein
LKSFSLCLHVARVLRQGRSHVAAEVDHVPRSIMCKLTPRPPGADADVPSRLTYD